MTFVPLARATSRNLFGGKAAQLAEAMSAGLPVPDGYALSVDAVEAIVRGGAVGSLPDGRWAVRSSAVDEDSGSASFAGQHLTRLAVASREVAGAVREVHASAHVGSARAYRERMGVTGPARMAVVVQRMVRAEVAGVLFTRNPLTGVEELLIEASWGLGEAVVAGLVTPDSFRVTREGRVEEARAGHKDVQVRHGAGGAAEQVPVEHARVAVLCLDAAQLSRLHTLAVDVTRAFGPAQDLEWAFDDRDALHLLQRRAVTT